MTEDTKKTTEEMTEEIADDTKKMTEDTKKEYIDLLSRFLCTVYKPLYTFVLPLVFTMCIYAITTVFAKVDDTIGYWVILSIIITVMIIEYLACRHLKLKHNRLDEKQLTISQKARCLVFPIVITLVLMMVVPYLNIYIKYKM